MQKDFENDLVHCSSCMATSGIFLYPTDTIWGLGADARDEAAVQRIIALKKRPAHKSFVILVAGLEQLKDYVAAPVDAQLIHYLNTVQKPTTVIYPGAKHLAPSVIAEDGSVAIRICLDPFCQALISRTRRPLLSTSANISGEPSPGLYKEISTQLIEGVDYVVQHRQQEDSKSSPSSIIKWHPATTAAHKEIKAASIEVIRP